MRTAACAAAGPQTAATRPSTAMATIRGTRALYGAHVCRRAGPGSPLLVLGSVARRLPLFKLLAIAQVALLTHRHLTRLNGQERRRLAQLVGRGPRLQAPERRELRTLVGKLEPWLFAVGAADAFSPVPLPKRLAGRRRPSQ